MKNTKTICIFGIIIISAILGIRHFFYYMMPPLDNKKALIEYSSFFESVKAEGLTEGHYQLKDGKWEKKELNGEIHKVNFSYSGEERPMVRSFRVDNGDIILFISGGIFTQDHEIIYSETLFIDISKYDAIKKLDENIFLCTIEFS